MKRFATGLVVLAAVALASCNPTAESAVGSGNKSVTIVAADRTIGKADAPIQFVEYAAPSCPWCAKFNNEVFPTLKRDYIDKGKVFYVFRVFPISEADFAAEALNRCVPEEKYFAFLDLLYKRQDVWDPENGVTNVQAGLIELANAAGMTQDKATACMQNKTDKERVIKNAKEAVAKYNLNSTPTFIINGKVRVEGFDTATLRATLDRLLRNK